MSPGSHPHVLSCQIYICNQVHLWIGPRHHPGTWWTLRRWFLASTARSTDTPSIDSGFTYPGGSQCLHCYCVRSPMCHDIETQVPGEGNPLRGVLCVSRSMFSFSSVAPDKVSWEAIRSHPLDGKEGSPQSPPAPE